MTAVYFRKSPGQEEDWGEQEQRRRGRRKRRRGRRKGRRGEVEKEGDEWVGGRQDGGTRGHRS